MEAITHNFGGGVYIKSIQTCANRVLVQHKHKHDHLSYLVSGTVEVMVDGVTALHTAPSCLLIKAGKHHGIKTLTDAVWLCIHAAENTDDVDEVLIAPSKVEDMQSIAEAM
tara:strand:- start:2534 stop:2866 length:333 start_codon:yes stop_codon:yes gene_type:complete